MPTQHKGSSPTAPAEATSSPRKPSSPTKRSPSRSNAKPCAHAAGHTVWKVYLFIACLGGLYYAANFFSGYAITGQYAGVIEENALALTMARSSGINLFAWVCTAAVAFGSRDIGLQKRLLVFSLIIPHCLHLAHIIYTMDDTMASLIDAIACGVYIVSAMVVYCIISVTHKKKQE